MNKISQPIGIQGLKQGQFVGGRSRRRSNSRAFRAAANSNAQIANKNAEIAKGLYGQVQDLKKQLKFERLRSLQSGPQVQFNNYGNTYNSFGQQFLNQPTALLQRNTLGALARFGQGGGLQNLLSLSNMFGRSPAMANGSARFNVFQLMAYSQAQGWA